MENHALLDAIIARWLEIKMKKIIYILIFLNILSSCQKSDEKMEDLIVGEWKVKGRLIDANLDGGIFQYPKKLPYTVSFYADGTYTTIYPDSIYSYSIVNGNLILQEYSQTSFRIKKINNNKIILFEDGEKWIYRNQ